MQQKPINEDMLHQLKMLSTLASQTQTSILIQKKLQQKQLQQMKQRLKQKIIKLSSQQINKIIQIFKCSLLSNNYEKVNQIIPVLKLIAQYNQKQSNWSFNKIHFDHMAKYIQQLKQYQFHNKKVQQLQIYKSPIQLIQIIYLIKGNKYISQSQILFSTLISKAQYLKQQNLELLVEVLVQLLKDNKKLLHIANKPYFFLQYWLHIINKQQEINRKLYWIQCAKNLYNYPKSQQYLFYKSDFNTFIDILISTIQNADSKITIKKCLQCYITLLKTQIIKTNGIGNFYRINDIKQKIENCDIFQLGIEKQAKQIMNLSINN